MAQVLDEALIAELRRLAAAPATSGRAKQAKASAIRTLERIGRRDDESPPGVLPPESGIVFALLSGLVEEFSEEQLRLGWEVYGPQLMATHSRPPGRPWAFWVYEMKEEPPSFEDEPVRLAELGLLAEDEIAWIAERTVEAKARIGTTAEHISALDSPFEDRPDQRAAALGDAVEKALSRSAT